MDAQTKAGAGLSSCYAPADVASLRERWQENIVTTAEAIVTTIAFYDPPLLLRVLCILIRYKTTAPQINGKDS